MLSEKATTLLLSSSFQSCRLKIQRADEHLEELWREYSSWLESNPFLLYSSPTSDVRLAYRLQIVQPEMIERLSVILADCLHNFRTALDNFVYAIAIHETGQDPPPNAHRLEFPIFDTAQGFAAKRSRIKPLSTTVQNALEKVQPYNRPHADLHRPLLDVLRGLNDMDKHRRLPLAVARTQRIKIEPWTNIPIGGFAIERIENGSLSNDDEVIAIVFSQPAPDFHLEMNLSFGCTLQYGSEEENVAIETIANLMSEEVRAVISEVADVL
ncbi:MAG: hypothetical protein AB7F88_06345 [Pyrinomonadaceae bacterium]